MLVYIHIPFCDSKCSYCAFNSYVDKFHLKKEYMVALKKQLEFELERFCVKEKSIETLFIGGGTPSTVAPQLYAPIFELLAPYFQENIEITSEANPNSATYEWLEGVYALGVNRVSFGVQSFDAQKLKLLHRAHTPQMALDALEHASRVGFKNLSLDIIYATAGDTKELLSRDLEMAFSLPINHLSAYALTIEEGTPFEKKPQMSSEQLEVTEWLFETIKAHGFSQYEISNFGSYQSRHNLGYWQYKDYMGVGAGAVGKLGSARYYPQTEVESYIANPLKIRVESLTAMDIQEIFLGMRSCVGIESSLLSENEIQQASYLVDAQKVRLEDNIYYNNDYLLADEIALFLTS